MTNDLADTTDGLAFVLYRSAARDGLGKDDLQAILASARERNGQHGITGCLHHEDGLFFRWLEGPAEKIDLVMAMIRKDGRHDQLTVLDDGALDQRRFRDWHMRFSDRNQKSLMDWLAQSDASTVNPGEYTRGIVAFLQALAI